jgi:hypothetical protein
MYERNAIVLERYFEKTFNFNKISNLRVNYFNYRNLIENYEKYSMATTAELQATEEFNNVSSEIEKLQKTQEKLYNKGAKFEYSRYIIFNDIKENPEKIGKYLTQVEENVEKNNEALKELGNKFVSTIKEYNEKKTIMEKCKKENVEAKKNFEEILEISTNCYNNIEVESLETAKEFINSENKEDKKELANIFTENGKNERNSFDTDVIVNTINVSISIYKIEMEIYLTGYDRIARFLSELDTDTVKIDKHKKFYNDSKIKLDFISAEKEYLIQFLDNERITAIYDKKVHRKLMLEACRNLKSDLEQINKLYDIIQKEIAGRFTKKLYKENYNKEYLVNLEKSSLEADLEQPRLKANTIAVMNLNYWRIDGIKRIYDEFDRDIADIYGRDLSEFQPEVEEEVYEEESSIISEDFEDVDNTFKITDKKITKDIGVEVAQSTEGMSNTEIIENIFNGETIPNKTKKSKRKKSKYGILKSSKKALANAIYISLQTHEFSPKEDVKEIQVIDEQEKNTYDGEYFDLDAKMASLDLLDEEKYEEDEASDVELDEEEFAEESKEESILDLYFQEKDTDTEKRKAKDNEILEKEVNKTGNILKKLIGINSKKKREA